MCRSEEFNQLPLAPSLTAQRSLPVTLTLANQVSNACSIRFRPAGKQNRNVSLRWTLSGLGTTTHRIAQQSYLQVNHCSLSRKLGSF